MATELAPGLIHHPGFLDATARARLAAEIAAILETAPHGSIRVNDAFASKTRRIKVSSVKSAKEQVKGCNARAVVDRDRKHAIDAALIRVMKSRKRLKFQELIGQAVGQLTTHFAADPKIVKARIDDLINRDFIERDGVEQNVLVYVN